MSNWFHVFWREFNSEILNAILRYLYFAPSNLYIVFLQLWQYLIAVGPVGFWNMTKNDNIVYTKSEKSPHIRSKNEFKSSLTYS